VVVQCIYHSLYFITENCISYIELHKFEFVFLPLKNNKAETIVMNGTYNFIKYSDLNNNKLYNQNSIDVEIHSISTLIKKRMGIGGAFMGGFRVWFSNLAHVIISNLSEYINMLMKILYCGYHHIIMSNNFKIV